MLIILMIAAAVSALTGMIDPVRPEVKAAIEECRSAGIRTVMITGDHKDTAVAIAKELGIITDASQAITGAELNDIPYIIGSMMDPEVGSFAALRAAGVSEHGMTMAFLTMSMCEIFLSFNLRSYRKSVFSLKKQNMVLWAAMIGSLVLTTLLLEVPFLAAAFGFMPIGLEEYAIAMGLEILVVPVVEIVKFFQRKAAK